MTQERFQKKTEEDAIYKVAVRFKRFGLRVVKQANRYIIFDRGAKVSFIRASDKVSSVEIIRQRLETLACSR